MQQVAVQKISSDCGKVFITVNNDMPLGEFHDFLLEIKGSTIDRMVELQKQENEMAMKQMPKEEEVKEEPVEAEAAPLECAEEKVEEVKEEPVEVKE